MRYHTWQVIQLLFWYAWFRQTHEDLGFDCHSFFLPLPYFPLGLGSITSRLKGENPTRIKTLEITFWFYQCDDRHSL